MASTPGPDVAYFYPNHDHQLAFSFPRIKRACQHPWQHSSLLDPNPETPRILQRNILIPFHTENAAARNQAVALQSSAVSFGWAGRPLPTAKAMVWSLATTNFADLIHAADAYPFLNSDHTRGFRVSPSEFRSKVVGNRERLGEMSTGCGRPVSFS